MKTLIARGALAALLLVSASPEALAKKKKAVKPAAAAGPASAAQKKELGELMGDFAFGMTKDQVLGKLKTELNSRYQEKISEVRDTYEQDKIRKERDQEIKRIESSFFAFEGKRSGWDVSIIDDQFGHNTAESMLVHWENVDGKDQRRFFFFHEGKLYKMFIALNSSVLKENQRTFAFFQDVMEKRFGNAEVVYTTVDGMEHPTSLLWKNPKYEVRAYDKLNFYGSFCLSIANPQTEEKVVALRKSKAVPPKNNSVIDNVVQKDKNEQPGLDENSGTVDAVIGD